VQNIIEMNQLHYCAYYRILLKWSLNLSCVAVCSVLGWINTEPHNSFTSIYTWQNAILSSSEGPLYPIACFCSTINNYSTPVCQHTHRTS